MTSHVRLPFQCDGTPPLTIEARVTAAGDPTQPLSQRTIIGDYQLGGARLQLRPEGPWKFTANDGDPNKPYGYTDVDSDEPAVVRKSVHLAGVLKGGEVTLFVDGKKQSTPGKLTQPFCPSPLPMCIGADPQADGGFHHHFSGRIDEVRFSKAARYEADFPPPAADARFAVDRETLALYHCDEGTGSLLVDSSGHARHGQIANARCWDGGKIRVYYNGRKGHESDFPALRGPQAMSDHFSIGCGIVGGQGNERPKWEAFQGIIDEVRISRTARYDGVSPPPPRFEPDADTMALYHFDEGSGEVAKDASGHGHDGKIVNAAWGPSGVNGPR